MKPVTAGRLGSPDISRAPRTSRKEELGGFRQLQAAAGNEAVQRLLQRQRSISIQRYPVQVPANASCQTVLSWMNSSNPYVPNWAKTRARFNWSAGFNITGSAPEFDLTLVNPGVTMSKSVDMPRWNPQDPDVSQRWSSMYSDLRQHESQHEAIADRWEGTLRSRLEAFSGTIPASSRSEANQAATGVVRREWNSWLAEHQQEQDGLDPYAAPFNCPSPAAEEGGQE